jgi:hypothetical protein
MHATSLNDIQVQPWYSHKPQTGLGDSPKVLGLRLRRDSGMRAGSFWYLWHAEHGMIGFWLLESCVW